MVNLIISKFSTVSVYISILKMENYICKNDNSHFLLSLLIYFCLLKANLVLLVSSVVYSSLFAFLFYSLRICALRFVNFLLCL